MINLDSDSSEEDEQLVEEETDYEINSHKPTALIQTNHVEEEYDEPITENQISDLVVSDRDQILGSSSSETKIVASPEFTEAWTAIQEDSWDISSWMIYLDETENRRAGNLSFEDACMKFLKYFPKCAKVWQKLGDYFLTIGDKKKGEQILLHGAKKCWNVQLWSHLLNQMINGMRILMKSTVNKEEIIADRAKCEAAFELSLEQVGLAVDSFDIWKAYIDFVADWPSTDPLDRNRKISLLRKIYQRAVCSAIDQVDDFWNSYKAFEKEIGCDIQVEPAFGELTKRHLHCKTILRDRKERVRYIVFDRFSTPPTNSGPELDQLEKWSQWISYELGNPDYLNSDGYKPMLRMAFQQCLCCFYYNPEVWLAFAKFEQHILPAEGSNSLLPKSILTQGIEAVPDSAILRIRLAELEEQFGDINAAKEIFRQMFEAFQDGYSFTVYQRFIHRTIGTDAARRVFSETQQLRTNNASLSVELYMAHATTELEMNSMPVLSLRILSLAKSKHPEVMMNMNFLKLFSRILIQLGEIERIRWLFRLAMEEIEKESIEVSFDIRSSEQSDPPSKRSRHQPCISDESKLRKQYELLEEFIRAETIIGKYDVQQLLDLRNKRHKIKFQLDEIDRTKLASIPGVRDIDGKYSRKELFDSACEVLDRCDMSPLLHLPETDREMKNRCVGRSSIEPIDSFGKYTMNKENKNMSSEFHLSLSGLPTILRDFLAQLPPFIGGQPDYDAFIRHMKTVILPPRPQPSEADTESRFSDEKREQDDINNDDDADNGLVDSDNAAFDVFRMRQRESLNL